MNWIFHRLAHEQVFLTGIHLQEDLEKDSIHTFVEKNSRVLDIGCGTGQVIHRLLPKTNKITGVDYNSDSIEIAQNKFKNTGVEIIHKDIFDYFKENNGLHFDYIILSHLLEHIDDPVSFLGSLTNKAKYFYIEVPDFEWSHLNKYREAIKTDLIYSDGDHVFEFDREELEKLINNCNLKVISSEFRYGVMKYWCESDSSPS